MAALLRWLSGFLPVAFSMVLKVWQAWMGIRLGLRLTLIGVVGALLPLPGWVEDLPAKIAALPPLFWWFAGFVELQFGVYVIVTAYTFRWVWREVFKTF